MALYHSARGSVNYTIVGSPTIVDGVASDFSSSNYLKTDTTFSQDVYNAWIQNSETVVKFRINALQAQHIIYIPTGGGYAGFYMRGSQGKINWQIYSTSYRISPDFVFSVNTDYWLKGTISNGVATFSYSTDGTNYTTLGTLDLQGITDPGSYTSYVQLGYGSAELGPVNGSIDLNHTYITVNGQPWFGICPIEVKKHQIMGPVGYTVVGSPTIEDGVLTNITANDYLSIGTYSGDTPTSIEIGSSFKTSNANVIGNAVIGRLTGADTGIFWGNSTYPGKLCFKHRVSYDNGTTWTAVESKSATLSLNTKYYVKFIISLAEQKLTGYVSTDNTNWTSYVANFNSGAILEGLTSIAVGKILGHNASPLPIYLDYTYIKVNGKLWFWQPQETKRIVVNGVEVWTKPE